MHTTLMENIRGAYIAHRWVRLASCAGLFCVALVLFALSGGFPPHSWRLLAQAALQLPSLLAQRGPVVLPAFLGLALLAFTLLLAWGALILTFVRIVLYEWRERQELRRFNADMAEAQHMAQTAEPLAATQPVNSTRRSYQPYPSRREEEEDPNFWEPDTEADMDSVDPWLDSPISDLAPASIPGRGVRSPSGSPTHRRSIPGPADQVGERAPSPPAPVSGRGDRSPSGSPSHRKPIPAPVDQVGERAPSPPAETDDEENATDPWIDTEAENESDIAEIPTGVHMMASSPAPRAAVASAIPVRSGSRALRSSGRLVSIRPDNAAPSYAEPRRAASLPTGQLPPREVPPVNRPEPQPRPMRDESVFFVPTTAPIQSVPHAMATTFYGDRSPVYAMPAPGSAVQELSPVPSTGVAPGTGALQVAVQEEKDTLQLIVGTGLDTGIRRRGKPNEDNLLALQNTRSFKDGPCPIGLFVVADGMGGHENGQEASRLVIQSLSESVVPAILYGPADDVYPELLAEGVHRANLAIYQRNRQQQADMGTTITAALIVNTTAYIVNAGDSRVYLYRSSTGLTQVTRDHSTVARLVEKGVITPEEVYTHPRRNEIYRCLGRHPSEEFDKFTLALAPGDLLLLCSDGLWEMVRDNEMSSIIQSTLPYPAQISSALVQSALNRGGKDNISLVAIYLKGG